MAMWLSGPSSGRPTTKPHCAILPTFGEMMSIKMLKAIAVALMLLALVLVYGAVSASMRSSDIQGPSALAVLPDQSVWLSVDEALWHLNGDGNRIAQVEETKLGIGRIGNLVLHLNGQLV